MALQRIDGVRVLVVDDDADMRLLVTTVLELCGAEVDAVGSAKEALESLEQRQPDVLLTDIGMPDLSGYDLIRTVRAREATFGGHIPAAAVTAYSGPEDRQRVLDAGFEMHLKKPLEPFELATAVASLVAQKPRY
jgi:CheY-like chemotaxis protein